MDKREANARYYAAHRDRIILRESELRPSTILELIDCLEDQEPHPHDKRVERLERPASPGRISSSSSGGSILQADPGSIFDAV